MRLSWKDVTPEAVFLNRRAMLAAMALLPAAARAASPPPGAPNSWDEITTHNNFVEFGLGKRDPSRLADRLTMAPWSVEIDGLVDRPGTFALADLVPPADRQERICRFRCVEGWSMVVPWLGVPLADVLARAGVQKGAAWVRFESVMRPEELPGQQDGYLDFPYVEGLRLDEATHPLTLLVTGLYGKDLPAQNGGPVRLIVPWKYGFKSAKSLVRISLTRERPRTTWNALQPDEYGFFANVNPNVDHPRWSQATERRLGAGLFSGREPTLMFNGYDEVAGLYAGQDLAADF